MAKKYDKIVFLDRDGVINEFPGNGNYVTKLKEFRFIPGALDALKILTEMGYAIFVITNQAGVGKGIYSRAKLEHITRNMLAKVRENGGRITKVFNCTCRSDENCGCRKPNIGSIVKALKSVNRTLKFAPNTFFVGDTKSDIEAGRKAGCKTIFALSGRETRNHIRKWKVKPDYIVKDLLEATKIINNENSAYSRLRRSRAPKSRRSRL